MHHYIIYENDQQDATVYDNLLFLGCSTCFEWHFRSSSGASKLYYSFWYYTRMWLPAGIMEVLCFVLGSTRYLLGSTRYLLGSTRYLLGSTRYLANFVDWRWVVNLKAFDIIIYENDQQDATVYDNLLFLGCSTCFEGYFCSSSRASQPYYSFWYYACVSLPAVIVGEMEMCAHTRPPNTTWQGFTQ